jgi:hypothetical protein
MKTTHKQNLLAAALLGALALTAAHAQKFSSEELHNRTVERRAVDAVIWGRSSLDEGGSVLREGGSR